MASSIPPDFVANGADTLAVSNGNGPAVKVYSFDPEASPQEKAAAAAKGREQLKPIPGVSKPGAKFEAKEVAIDTGKNAPAPTITIDDADSLPPKDDSVSDDQDAHVPIPGALTTAKQPNGLPAWYKTGWRQVSGIDDAPLEGEELEQSVLDAYINEAYYGEWWQNVGVIFFAVLASHFITILRGGWGWLILILAVCGTYYNLSMRRFRQRARSDIQRELSKARLSAKDEFETADWMNNFLDRFWLIYEPILSATIVSSVDQVLSASTPAFLDSIRLSTFTLGTRAPRIDRVHTYPRTADDEVLMDWGFSFIPNDIQDITPRQAATRVNPKIVLAIRIGKSLATATMPILLEDLAFSGIMRVKMKLMTQYPHIQIVDLSFMEKPVFDYVLKPIGGETFGFDIANMPGLSSFIRDTVHSILGPMMYHPAVFTLNLEQMLSGAPIDAAIGVVQIFVRNASGLKGRKIGGGDPDPYVSISINKRAEMARTKHRPDTHDPTWNEVKFILIKNLTEQLTFNVMDFNDHRKDYDMGLATFELAKLEQDATHENIVLPVVKDGKERGEMLVDISYFPVIKPKVVDGVEEPMPETKTGIVRLVVHQAKELDASKTMSNDLNPFARVYLGGESGNPIHATPIFKHTVSPVWESATEFLCADRMKSVVTVNVVDDRDFVSDPVIGHLSIKLDDLLKAKEQGAGKDWWPLSRCKTGRLRMSAEWKPLNMAGSMSGADQYVPPIGIVRLWLKKAVDVKNVEGALGGKSDPYVRVMVNNVTLARTEVVNNNLNPEWDSIHYVPVHTLKEVLRLELMDYQHLTKDRTLGMIELKMHELAQESGDIKFPYAATGKIEKAEKIKVDGGFKGELFFAAEFVPAMRLKNIKFDSHGTEIDRAVEMADNDQSSLKQTAQQAEVTVSRPVGENESVRTPSPTSPDEAKAAPTADEGVELSVEELFSHQSGVVVFDVISGVLPKKCRMEILLDDGYWPAFGTTKARSTHAQWDQVGEGFIKELDFSKIWLRLNENDEGDKDDIIAQFKYDAKPFLQQTLNGESTFSLKNDLGDDVASVVLAARYIPVDFKLEPRESVNNQGILRVTLMDGKDIHAADRGKTSDPYVNFYYKDDKLYKSQTIMKTLSPVWNETFDVQIPSRTAGGFRIEVFDWDRVGTNDSLGEALVPLDDLEPFHYAERTYSLTHKKHGNKGVIRLGLLFQPEIIAKQRKATSVVGGAGRAMTQVGALPVHAGKGLVTGVGGAVGGAVGGVAKGVGGVFKRDHAPKQSLDGPALAVTPASPVLGGQQTLASTGNGASQNTFPSAGYDTSPPSFLEAGTLRVVIRSAQDLGPDDDIKPYVQLKHAGKEHKTKHLKGLNPQWEESFTLANVGPETKSITLTVFDKHTFGKDAPLGTADIDLWRHLQPSSGVAAADVRLELTGGTGQVLARLEFEMGPSLERNASHGSADYGSASRFSLSGARRKTRMRSGSNASTNTNNQ